MEDFKIPEVPPAINAKSPLPSQKDTGLGYISCQQLSTNENLATKEAFDKNTIDCPYEVPKWSGTPSPDNYYGFEVLKSGQIIEEIKNLEKKAFWVFGRLPGNDIEMAHPTISRYHAVFQYRPTTEEISSETTVNESTEESTLQIKEIEKGWYVYDLGSTHGTYLNKMRVPSKVYIQVKVGHILRFGTSTRRYILQGPPSDEEPESELSVTELRDARARLEEQKILKQKMQEEAREREGISWGLTEDAEEESDLSINPYAATNNEELFLDDPKKTLRGFFEREGLTLEYKCDEMSPGSFLCSVPLPIDDVNGRPIVAEVSHKGRKKECVVQCALEACRILDRHGILRQAHHEPLKRKTKLSDSDDDDDFLDRTGDIERKKIRKTDGSNTTLTYDDLLEKENELMTKIAKVDDEVAKYQETVKRLKENNSQNQCDLDSYMENLDDQTHKLDKTEIKKLRVEQQRLQIEYKKIQRLVQIAKPYELPFFTSSSSNKSKDTSTIPGNKKQLPMVGKRNQFKLFTATKPISKQVRVQKPEKVLKSDEEEMEDDETDEETDKETPKSDDINMKNENPKISNKDVSEKGIELSIPNTNAAEKPESQEKSKQIENTIDNSIDTSESGTSAADEDEIESKKEQVKLVEDTFDKSINSEESGITEEESMVARKRRNRLRMRNKRQEVDIDDLVEHETSDKYAKWIPPLDQTGDGLTPLNEKFGY